MKVKSWRCFHCGDVFTNAAHAASHFGIDELQLPGCVAVLRHGEGHLLDRIRDLEEQLARYRAEDSDIMRWSRGKAADHAAALRTEEEKGYARGLRAAMSPEGWDFNMDVAPRDGTLLMLLIGFDDERGNALEDEAAPTRTVGFNNLDHDGEDVWKFAGWCWSHDHFTEGEGKPVAWRLFPEGAAASDQADDDHQQAADDGRPVGNRDLGL